MKNNIREIGWGKLYKGFPWFSGEGRFPIRAYSEFMPPVRTGFSPCDGKIYPWIFSEDDLFGFRIDEIEEEYQLKPGLESISKQLFKEIAHTGQASIPARLRGHNGKNITGNLFGFDELLAGKLNLKQERYISFMPLSLSRTKDDKGRIRWTCFGASEQGPEKAFWKSFCKSPSEEQPVSVFLSLMQWVFKTGYDIKISNIEDLANLGFRILPGAGTFPFAYWNQEILPGWTKKFIINEHDPFKDVNYLLSFRPFSTFPEKVKEKYLSGQLALFPFPGSMLPWGSRDFIRLQQTLPNAIQIPLLGLINRHEQSTGIRVPQAGWFHEPGTDGKKAEILEELLVHEYIRTSRWDKFNRHEDALLKSTEIDPVVKTLFSAQLVDMDLYNKPMARNCQLFSENMELLLDGPNAAIQDIEHAAVEVLKGGLFNYRFYFPPMQAGLYELFWHKPVAMCLSAKTGQPEFLTSALNGYITAYRKENRDPANPIELWPFFRRDELRTSALINFEHNHDHYTHQTSLNVLSILDSLELSGKKTIEESFARHLVRIRESESMDEWMDSFPERSVNPDIGNKIRDSLKKMIVPDLIPPDKETILTFNETATRDYEESYWNKIKTLSHGIFLNKDNADVVKDTPTLDKISHHKRDLFRLGNFLISEHEKSIYSEGMEGIAEVGELPFKWETDFRFNDFGGWAANQEGTEQERNILVIIPGKNRNQAVIMADHYDTAYMADVFDKTAGGSGARLSAPGADDNSSATSTLLLAAPIFLKLSKEGKLERDIWLLHLTGEEFPSDSMGARNLCQHLVQHTLKLKTPGNTWKDLSSVEISGFLIMDMIAHNRESGHDIFQISPGRTPESLQLAHQALKASLSWNAFAGTLNHLPDRNKCTSGKRSTDPETIPEKALHLLPKPEIRTWDDPYSTLYNTDGMILSDVGVPVILFMENYDINRTGYHDTQDTMENIDLDYGSAISAIAIETIARLACLEKLVQ